MEDKFQDGGEKIDSYPGDPCLLSDSIWTQKSENSRDIIPTTAKYITATGKQKSAASLIPVPLIKEAIGVALKVIELCEVSKISDCKMVYIILLSEYIFGRSKG